MQPRCADPCLVECGLAIQRIDNLERKVNAMALQVEKLDRLVCKLFKRLPREKAPAAQPGETA